MLRVGTQGRDTFRPSVTMHPHIAPFASKDAMCGDELTSLQRLIAVSTKLTLTLPNDAAVKAVRSVLISGYSMNHVG